MNNTILMQSPKISRIKVTQCGIPISIVVDEEGNTLALQKDFSSGLYHQYAIVGRKGYAKMSGPFVWWDICKVVLRQGKHRVWVKAFYVPERRYFESPDEAMEKLRQITETSSY